MLHARLQAALRAPIDGHANEDESDLAAPDGGHRAAAVLIPFTDRAEPGVILTQRPQWLRSHAGQVAFPGGKVDDTDTDVVAAALREADEELGLPRDAVRVAGVAGEYRSGSGYRITPVLGVIAPDFAFDPNPEE
ncbi:MAG: hypothetical protein RLZZ58_1342, partial [Pseudomonadota bacterium]